MHIVLSVVLYAAITLGHLALMVRIHNWCYGLPLPRSTGKFVHLFFGLLVLAFPTALYLFQGWDLVSLFTPPESVGPVVLLGYLALCLLVGCVIFPLVTLLRALRRQPVGPCRSEVVRLPRQPGEGLRGLMIRLPRNEVFEVEFLEKVVFLPQLPPAWDGLTVLHLSDLHFNGTPHRAFFEAVIERANAWQPDLVAVTGDIADSIEHQRWIAPVLGGLRWNVEGFAILGNHDFWYEPSFIRRQMRRQGLHVVSNSWTQVEVRGQPLVVIGNERPWEKAALDLNQCPTEPFRLCLSHTPDNFAWALREQVDLMLSGHVHGGQIRVPGIGSILVPSRYGRQFDCGTFLLSQSRAKALALGSSAQRDTSGAGRKPGTRTEREMKRQPQAKASLPAPALRSAEVVAQNEGTQQDVLTTTRETISSSPPAGSGVHSMVLHVNRGLSGEHPLRYFCRPEVTLLTLQRGTS